MSGPAGTLVGMHVDDGYCVRKKHGIHPPPPPPRFLLPTSPERRVPVYMCAESEKKRLREMIRKKKKKEKREREREKDREERERERGLYTRMHTCTCCAHTVSAVTLGPDVEATYVHDALTADTQTTAAHTQHSFDAAVI